MTEATPNPSDWPITYCTCDITTVTTYTPTDGGQPTTLTHTTEGTGGPCRWHPPRAR